MTAKNTGLWVTMTRRYVEALDELVEAGGYISRGAVIREGLRLLFQEHGMLLKPMEAEG